jgi:hypothetical protein
VLLLQAEIASGIGIGDRRVFAKVVSLYLIIVEQESFLKTRDRAM